MRKYKGGGLCKTLTKWLKKGQEEINESKEVANNIKHFDINDFIRI